MSLPEIAKNNVASILEGVFHHASSAPAVIVADQDCPLAVTLLAAYTACLPQARVILFSSDKAAEIREALFSLPEKSLAVLIQSSSFRLDDFRIRIELFKRGLQVIEHPHLLRIEGEEEAERYVASLAYDASYYHRTGKSLKTKIDQATEIFVETPGGSLHYRGPFEEGKLNIGDYSQMKNAGGQFPIGEVFTEPKDLTHVSGVVDIFAFGGMDFRVRMPQKSVRLTVRDGLIVNIEHSTPDFDAVIHQISTDETLLLRELGFGLNRAFTRNEIVSDVGSYERMCGVHISLGAKHSVYGKPGISKRQGKYHVDCFVDVTRVMIDAEMVFEDGKWMV